MALSASALSALIKSNMQAVGANGSNLQKFCDAVAAGIVMSVVGQSFTTSDNGLVPGVGTGTGTGIVGLTASPMADISLSSMSSRGSNASKLMNAIMMAVVGHLASAASLSSTDPDVFEGIGNINIGSITVVESAMANNILAQMQAAGAKGKNLQNLCDAIAIGVTTGILTLGTGILTITGSPISFPGPGTGTGTGTIS